METKISNEVETCNLQQGAVMRSASVDIVDSDIATIEALHDLLLDAHGYQLDFITLKRARELTHKMYAAFDKKLKCDCGNTDDVKEIAICVNCYNNGEW